MPVKLEKNTNMLNDLYKLNNVPENRPWKLLLKSWITPFNDDDDDNLGEYNSIEKIIQTNKKDSEYSKLYNEL